jgi:hypothetical protein
MATYTYTQLYGSGSIGENLTGQKTFTFINPSGSSYFAMETLRDSRGFYNSSSLTNFVGSYITSESMGLVTSSYIASVVIQPGTSSFKFSSSLATVLGSNYYLRGTGMYSLTIS